MRRALIIFSCLSILIGIWAGPGHWVIKAPPEAPLYQLRQELAYFPAQGNDANRLIENLDDGISRSRIERERLSGHLNKIGLSLLAIGSVGLLLGIYVGRIRKKPDHTIQTT